MLAANLKFGSPGRTRTADQMVNSHPLYQLSYRGVLLLPLLYQMVNSDSIGTLPIELQRNPVQTGLSYRGVLLFPLVQQVYNSDYFKTLPIELQRNPVQTGLSYRGKYL